MSFGWIIQPFLMSDKYLGTPVGIIGIIFLLVLLLPYILMIKYNVMNNFVLFSLFLISFFLSFYFVYVHYKKKKNK